MQSFDFDFSDEMSYLYNFKVIELLETLKVCDCYYLYERISII